MKFLYKILYSSQVHNLNKSKHSSYTDVDSKVAA